MSKFYVTTAIPYVNDKPHLGHAILHLYADVLARYHRALGDEVIFSAGTDEHGEKIAEKAAAAKLEPQQFADQISQLFRELLTTLNISNDRFIRTTDAGHEQRAQVIWQKLKPFIYKGEYEGWYCTGHEEYFPEKVVKDNKGICPEHNRPYEKLKEENYFFKASQFSDTIKQAIESDQFRILPKGRKNEILSVLKSGLEDTSISRPKDKINWGIPVPGDDTQVMYVWFEALMNYITVLGYPEHKDFAKYWPADVQVIGKDILRFHAAIWPAMLLGLKVDLPKLLYAHGFVTNAGQKMSKTLGNVVDPIEVSKNYGVDAFRYYFLRYGPAVNDADFTWDHFNSAYNDELADQLGNGVSRIAAMVTKYQKGLIGDIPAPDHDVAQYQKALADCRFDKALELVWEQVKGLNQYIDETKPWEIAKTQDETHMREVLAYMAASLLEIAEMLGPFMPETATKIKDVFGTGILKPLAGPMFPKHQEPKAQLPTT
ncbi:MAG TPA: methionine--tRNA ligase [Candidatus Saccharimonadales bacterium]|nr:methionine--tRNA ligase [Candidatus Saccharimonadales bacterium]